MKILVAITFHFVEHRLGYLEETIRHLAQLNVDSDLRVFTNSDRPEDLSRIKTTWSRASVGSSAKMGFELVPRTGLADPFLLTWCHKELLSSEFMKNEAWSHFLYLEDDEAFTQKNLDYWLEYRPILSAYGLIPSFFRVERDQNGTWRSTDTYKSVRLRRQPRLKLSRQLWFVNMRNPYQGMYLFDRVLAQEHVEDDCARIRALDWGIREQAAQGLTFTNVPKGFSARNVVPYERKSRRIPQYCWVHHLPNNYALDPESPLGSLSMDGPEILRRGIF